MADEQTPLTQAAADEEPKLKLTIKSTKHKDSVEVACDCTVRQVSLDTGNMAQHCIANFLCLSLQLKELLSERNQGVAIAQLCLIFAGKILKDDETLEKQGVKDGLTIHMVIRSSGAKVR